MKKLTKFSIFFFFFILISVQGCFQPNQLEGSCTKCQSTQNLQKGFCYPKIRGCLIQSQNFCSQCQQGYVLSQNACTRTAQFYNITSLNPPPQVIQDKNLNSSAITPIIVGGFQQTTNFTNELYLVAQAGLYKQYPFLQGYTTYKVQEQIVNGMNYIFYIIDTTKYDLYLAKIYISFAKQVNLTQIYKNDVSIKKGQVQISQTTQPLPGAWKQFMNVSDSRYIQSKNYLLKNFNGLDTYNLTRVEYQIVAGINFIFYWKHIDYNQEFKAKIYKPFYGQTQLISTWGLAPAQVLKSHQTSQSSQIPPVSGQYQIVSSEDYEKEPFLSVKKTIQKVFPDFQNSLIKSVYQQVVAGFIHLITFSYPSSSDVYQLRVYSPLPYTNQDPSIQYIKKNGLDYQPSTSQNTTENGANSNNPPTPNSDNQATNLPPTLVGGMQLLASSQYDKQPFLTAKATIQKVFPTFDNSLIVTVYQQLVSGWVHVVSFKFKDSPDLYQVRVYSPLPTSGLLPQIQSIKKNEADYTVPNSQQHTSTSSSQNNIQPNNNLPTQSTPNLVGQGQLLTLEEYKKQPFLSVKATILKVFPLFDDSLIKTVYQQLVSGWNHVVTFSFKNSADVYEVKVYSPLPYTNLPPQITSIKKNGIQYKPSQDGSENTATKIDPTYSWQNDPIFTELYKYFKSEVNIINLPSITEVQRKQVKESLKYWEYKIIYSSNEYAICRYYPDYGVNQVISYIADSTQIYRLGDKLNVGAYDRSESVLAQKIKISNPTKFNRLLVRQIVQLKLSDHYTIYKINCYTSVQHYQIDILDKGGQLFVVKSVVLDKNTCFPIRINSVVQYRQQYVVDQIKTFLLSKYNLTGFQLTMAVINSYSNNTSQYRILLARNDSKKIQVFVEQAIDKFVVKKIDILNNGLYLLNDQGVLKSLQDLARKQYPNDLLGFNKNVTLTNTSVYYTKYYNQTTLSTYMRLAQSSTHDLKSENFAKPNDCITKTTNTNVCINCSEKDVLFNGKCYTKVQNCGIQLGNICIVCDKFSIQVGNKCIKDCTQLFKL